MKILNVVGARPQFVKAAAVCRAMRARPSITDLLVNTGQHYDAEMSDVFFEQLALPRPHRELGIGSGSHGEQTGRLLAAIEKVIVDENPDLVLVYGDTNTTLAGALAAVKIHVPVGHVEGGMRSFDRDMPEEINRIVSDHVSSLHFCPSSTAVENLRREGITDGVHLVGDVMFDVLSMSLEHKRDDVLDDAGVQRGEYYLMTLHRAGNTDDAGRLAAIIKGAGSLDRPVLFPVHPRTRKAMASAGIEPQGSLRLMPPLGYLDFLAFQSNARAILTDSGGVQKEAYMLGVPCITLRAETEWVETVDAGWNTLVDADAAALLEATERTPPSSRPSFYGDGNAADKIAAICEVYGG